MKRSISAFNFLLLKSSFLTLSIMQNLLGYIFDNTLNFPPHKKFLITSESNKIIVESPVKSIYSILFSSIPASLNMEI